MIPIFPDTKVALKGKKGLIVGIANDQSIAWGCAKAFRALGAELAVTYLNERAKKHVEPLAQALEAPIFMPMDVMVEGQTEQVFERIEKEWGQLDFLLHSIAFSPKEALQGRVVDVGRDGFLKTMEVSCWSSASKRNGGSSISCCTRSLSLPRKPCRDAWWTSAAMVSSRPWRSPAG